MKKRWKLAACWTLIASLSTQMVIPGFAGVNMQETVSTVYKAGLCEHHPEHDEDCGYGHEHDEECYTEVLNCVHEHEEDCYLDDDLTEEEEATPSDADEREAENCPHICDEESGCITWVLDCPYGQDESNMGTCGYVCDICEEELATDSNASQLIISAEYVQELIDALPNAEDINDENADEVIEQLEAIDDAKLLLTEEELEFLDFTKYEAAAAALGSVYEVATLADAVRVGDFKITTDGTQGTDYTYENGVLTIETSTPVTIENADPDTATADRIVVKKDVSADIMLAGVNIDVSATDGISAFEIEKDSAGDVKITLADGTSNQLKAGTDAAVLQKEGINGSLTIQCEDRGEENHICTDACGELQISAGLAGTGIGSGYAYSENISGSVSNIMISGGMVTVNSDGTGIGSGHSQNGGTGAVFNITITGGVVTVSTERYGTGIGSGVTSTNSGTVSNITIAGGVVTVNAGADGTGIGIGSGDGTIVGAVSDITIIGGSVLTTSIGCTPDNGNGENVYRLTLANPNSETVYIDGEEYVPVNHLAADENDTNLYVYLTGEAHKVKIGDKVTHYHFAENAFVEGMFSDSYLKDETGHWHECADGICEIKTESENHDFSSNGKCSKCDYDGAAPTGEISIGSRKWNQFLSEPAFEVFFKEHQTVTITASDNSGDTVAIGYLLSDQKRTEEELHAADFSAYAETFTVSLDQYIVYAKLTDSTGNATYINTDGIVLDQTAPVISGVKNGSIYCGAQTVTINETNLESVTVNDADVKLDTNGQFQLLPAESAQKIAAVDKAGNRTEISVTVNNGHTPKADDGDCTTAVLCQYCDEIAVAAKEHDFSDEWKRDEYEHWHECMNEGCTIVHEKGAHSGTATCTSKAVCEDCGEEHGNINPSNHSSLQHEKAVKPTKSKEGHIEYWYCIGCGNYYSDKALTHEISLEDTVIDCLDEDDGSETSGILNIVNRIFADVAETDAYYNDILFVYNNGLMSGSGGGFFTPNGSVTGLQIAEILYQMEGRPTVTEADRLAAGHSNHGYGPGMIASYDAVVWAQKAGLDIAANQQMTREQLVLTLYRYAQYKGYDVSVGENTNILSYQDFAQISEEIIPAVQWAVGMGILKDNGTGILNPKGIVIRAQLAGIIHDFIIKYDLVSAVSESGMIIWVKKKNEINL